MKNFNIVRNINFIILSGFIVFTSCGNQSRSKNQDDSFKNFKEYYIQQLWQLNPTSALYAGYHQLDSVLIVPTAEERNHTTKAYEALLDTLNKFNENELNDLDKIDFWMMRDNISSNLWYINSYKSHEWNPSNYNIASEVGEILNGNYAPLATRLKSILSRIKKSEAYYSAAKSNLRNPTIEHTDLAIIQHEGSIDEVFGKGLQDSIQHSNLTDEEKTLFNNEIQTTRNAMQSYVAYLKDLKENKKCTGNFRLGKQLYEEKFRHDIASQYSATEIYTKALDRKKQLHASMSELSKKLWPKYFGNQQYPSDSLIAIRKVIDALSINHVHRDSFISSIEMQIPELISFINKKQLIYIDPAKPLVVRKTPAYMEGSGAGASISAPGPYDKNANTYYNVSPLTGYTAEDAESYLREYNYYVLQILNIHEAIPGHYTQLVYSNQSPSIIKSILGNGAMIEGWAVYTERMMLENGYGNNSDEMWMMYNKWHLRSVCNTILDYSVHVNNITEEAAKSMLMNEAFQQKAEADGKWRRAKLTSVQLTSYFTGYTEIYDFREELKKSDQNFDLKKFHEQFLSYGSAPVKYIKTVMTKKK